jgi:membrane dipeptidase
MNAMYFDAHCDTLTAYDGRYGRIRLELEKESYSVRAQIFAVCGDNSERPLTGLLETCVSRLNAMENVKLCRTARDLLCAESEKKTAAFLSIEGAEVLDCDEKKLDFARSIGVNFIGLTWNIANGLSGTCVQNRKTGLTPEGFSFAKKALEKGMVLDISHISDSAAGEIIELAGGRAYASHSNSRAVCKNPRNLTDALFISLAKSSGVCGINLYPPFLKKRGTAKISDVILHIEHFASLFPGAAGHIALGCDLDGCGIMPEGIETSKDISRIYEALLKENYPEQCVKDIFYGNLRAFIIKTIRE